MGWGTAWLTQLGSSAPEAHCRRLVDYLDGVILHHLVFPSPTLAPCDAGIREMLAGFASAQRQP